MDSNVSGPRSRGHRSRSASRSPARADYARGIVVAPPNLTVYRNVALGPMLEDHFALPVFINNDG